jgi:hypothetical protein
VLWCSEVERKSDTQFHTKVTHPIGDKMRPAEHQLQKQRFDPVQMIYLANEYRRRQISMVDVLEAISDCDGNLLHPCERTVRQYWRDHGIDFQRPPAPRMNPMDEATTAIILERQALPPRLGVHRMHDFLQSERYDHLGPVSRRDGSRIYESMDLFRYRRITPLPPQPRVRYVADYADMLWHTGDRIH